MHFERAPLGLKIAAFLDLAFLHLPILLIFVYAFTTEDKTYQWPPPGFTLKWLEVTCNQPDVWEALSLLLQVASISTCIALIPGTLAAAAVSRTMFLGREAITLLVILPIVLPGIITSIALRSAFNLADISFSILTVVLGHATFCIVVVYNNSIARFRRISALMPKASANLGETVSILFATYCYLILGVGAVASSTQMK